MLSSLSIQRIAVLAALTIMARLRSHSSALVRRSGLSHRFEDHCCDNGRTMAPVRPADSTGFAAAVDAAQLPGRPNGSSIICSRVAS